VSYSILAPAFLTSVLVHLTALMSLSLLWGSLHMAAPRSDLIPTEVVIATPPPPPPEPIATAEIEPITPPRILTKTDVVLAQPPPSTPVAPLTPTKVEPITPPKAIEKVPPKRAEPSPKPPPAAKPHSPSPRPETKTLEKPKPGLFTPLPDEGPAPTGANTLGPSAADNAADRPAKPVEGGEAGAGALSERGDLPAVPGTGVGGGSGGPGRAGLGSGAEGSGVRAGGLRPGAGGEGPGGGADGVARPLGGYQLLPRYPDSARRQGISGTTTLLFEVLTNGRVGNVQVESSAGHPDLDRAAADAIKQWRFEPARRGNQPVAVWLRMPVRFVLR
jgi:periplasmic protein TonB